MFLQDHIKESIKQHALESDGECCGLVILCLKTKKLMAVKSRNVSAYPKESFVIDPFAYVKADSMGQIVAVYHSHKSDSDGFSDLDILNSETQNITYLMYCVGKDTFHQHVPTGTKNKYVGRVFSLGENDCYGLVRDYYANELKIYLTNYFRDKNWMLNTPMLCEKVYEKEGFERILSIADLKKHDLILMNFYPNYKFATHLCVYLGNSLILNHPRGKASLIEFFGPSYQKRVTLLLRHKNVN